MDKQFGKLVNSAFLGASREGSGWDLRVRPMAMLATASLEKVNARPGELEEDPNPCIIAARAPCDVFDPWVRWERGQVGI